MYWLSFGHKTPNKRAKLQHFFELHKYFTKKQKKVCRCGTL